MMTMTVRRNVPNNETSCDYRYGALHVPRKLRSGPYVITAGVRMGVFAPFVLGLATSTKYARVGVVHVIDDFHHTE